MFGPIIQWDVCNFQRILNNQDAYSEIILLLNQERRFCFNTSGTV